MSFVRRNVPRREYARTRAAVADIANERMLTLLERAKAVAMEDEALSRRYVALARKISERTKVRIPSELKKYLCKKCGIALVPGRNARIRLRPHSSGVVITCLSCGSFKRYPIAERTSSKNLRPTMKPYIAQSGSSPKKN